MRTLVNISYSPWSERARWALDHHGLAYQQIEYLIMLGEPWLRAKVGRRGKVSVPVLFDEGQVFEDSYVIAERAEAVGQGPSLFADRDAVRRWVEVAERACAEGRRRSVERLLDDPEALSEALPPPFVGPLKTLGRPVAKSAASFVLRKYDAPGGDALEDALQQLRAGLAGGDHLVGDTLSFADIAMASVLEYVEPGDWCERGPATRRVWGEAPLAEQFSDVVAWRDRLYANHRH